VSSLLIQSSGALLDDPRLLLCLFIALIAIVVVANYRAVLRRMSWNPPVPDPNRSLSALTVIIPARNEEADLEVALSSILSQEGIELKVIVVNDHSSDRTGAIADEFAAGDPRVTVIHDPELPPGWLGKCNAMQQAAAHATTDLLLFTDADIVYQPGCLVRAVTELDRDRLDFLSLFPRMDFISLWENILLPAMVGGLGELVTPGVNDPKSPDAMGAGAFLLVRTRAFYAAGGFEPIKHEIGDDVALARLLKRSGCRTAFHGAPEWLSVRLYKGNHHAFWGMTKNILIGLEGRYWLAPLIFALPVFVYWTPIYCFGAGLVERNAALAIAAAAAYGVLYLDLWIGRSLLRLHPGKALFFPLVVAPVVCCLARALYLHFCKGAVHWRGRTITVRQGAGRSGTA
jgi:glycosyltransferase involved in cell wall biosynthesis